MLIVQVLHYFLDYFHIVRQAFWNLFWHNTLLHKEFVAVLRYHLKVVGCFRHYYRIQKYYFTWMKPKPGANEKDPQQKINNNPKFIKRVEELVDILLTKKKYKHKPFVYLGISFDLVLVLNIPKHHQPEGFIEGKFPDIIRQFRLTKKRQNREAFTWTKIDKAKAITIGQIRKSVPPELVIAYENAMKEISKSIVQNETGKQILRFDGGLKKNNPGEEKEYIALPQMPNLFQLIYNSIIITLQKDCGFICEKIILVDKIFILISCTDENLMRAAHKYGMKKQVLYSQIDIMLNEPLDDKFRPIRFNTYLVKSEQEVKKAALIVRQSLNKRKSQFISVEESKLKSKLKGTSKKLLVTDDQKKKDPTQERKLKQQQQEEKELFNLNLHKNLYRKIGKAPASEQVQEIKEQVVLSRREKQKYKEFLNEYYKLLEKFNTLYRQTIETYNAQNEIKIKFATEDEFAVSEQDQQYLQTLLPQRKLNRGCRIIYKNIMQKIIYFNKVKKMMFEHNYDIFSNPPVYTQFFRLGKRKKFADKLKTLLMFKPLIVGALHNRRLFLRMQRTKLSYSIMQQFLRVQNFKKMGLEVFTLHSSYEKNGKIPPVLQHVVGNHDERAGGLDGQNLQANWNPFTPWKSDVKLIRNYLGEKPAFFIMLKNHIILYLMGFCPVAILAYIIMLVILPTYGLGTVHINQFCFFLTLELILIAWLTILSADWDRKANDFINSFVEKRVRKTILPGYKAPYVRNLATDLINDFPQTKSFVEKLIEAGNYCIVLGILGIEIAIFYGIRRLNHVLTQSLYNDNFVRWQQLLPIFIFFCGNHLLYLFVLKRLISYLTTLQNNPNFEKSQSSQESKKLLFLVGLELIGPIDLLIVQPLNRTSCNDTSCFQAFDSFIQSRFIVIFITIAFKFTFLMIQILVQKIRTRMVREGVAEGIKIAYDPGDGAKEEFKALINKLLKEHEMPEFKTQIEDEILVLVHMALFSVTLPIAIAINLFNVLMQYYLQRLHILRTCRRPINFITVASNYSSLVHIPLYLFCAINAWLLFITFEDWEYVVPGYFKWFVDEPTIDSVITIKILTAFVWFLILMLLSKGVRHIYDEHVTSDNINRRKDYKLKEYLYNFKRARNTGTVTSQVPLKFVGRVQMKSQHES